MNCERITELYTDLYDGTLTSSAKQQAEHHMSVCTDCRADYERFSIAMHLLDEPLPEVDPPVSFRAEILAKVAQQPKASRFPWLDSLRERFAFPASSVRLAGALGVAMVIIAVGVLQPWKAGSHQEGSPGLVPHPLSAPTYTGVFKNLSVTAGADKTYHNFTLQLPTNQQQAFVTAYVLQDDRAITDDTAEQDPGSATLAWRQNDPVRNDVQVNIPVAVVSDVPVGTTMTFLVESTGIASGSQERKDVAIVPLDDSKTVKAIAPGATFYSALEAVAATQDISIVLDDSAVRQMAADVTQYKAPANIDGTTQLSKVISSLPDLRVVEVKPGATYAIVAN